MDHESVRATVYCKSVEKLVVAHFVEKYPCFNGRARQHSAQTQAVGTACSAYSHLPSVSGDRLLYPQTEEAPPVVTGDSL